MLTSCRQECRSASPPLPLLCRQNLSARVPHCPPPPHTHTHITLTHADLVSKSTPLPPHPPPPHTHADLVSKSAALQVVIGGKTVTIGGMCKGSGMIHPNMATMLGVVTTDAAVEPELWRAMVKKASVASFNSVSLPGAVGSRVRGWAMVKKSSVASFNSVSLPGAVGSGSGFKVFGWSPPPGGKAPSDVDLVMSVS